ncbi:Hypothetical predicted protein [Lecanosticta acicola]|uniref:Uncharacterized protein n=1 Tax=Lecanosticta acicola TaxID=111012 RepID=A0AAI9E8U4_9PEZI|nr:Hypothetical predicted protein [Lecanosticta acicola]
MNSRLSLERVKTAPAGLKTKTVFNKARDRDSSASSNRKARSRGSPGTRASRPPSVATPYPYPRDESSERTTSPPMCCLPPPPSSSTSMTAINHSLLGDVVQEVPRVRPVKEWESPALMVDGSGDVARRGTTSLPKLWKQARKEANARREDRQIFRLRREYADLMTSRSKNGAHGAITKSDPEDLSPKSTKEQSFNFRSEAQTEQEYLGLQNQNATCSQLDGSVEPPSDTQTTETVQERLRREDPKGVGSGALPSTQNSNIGIKSGLKVADRIRNFEQRAVPSMSANAATRDKKFQHAKDSSGSDRSRTSKGETPLVFPLHLKKFRRRASGASPLLRAETPLYRSQPEGYQYLHAPLPQRRSTLVANTPPGTPPPLEAGEDLAELALQQANDEAAKSGRNREEQKSTPDTSNDVLSSTAPSISLTEPNKTDPEDMSPEPASRAASQQSVNTTADPPPTRAFQQPTAGGKRTARALQPPAPVASSKFLSPTLKQRINPFAHFHGTRGTCVRHGRKYGNGSREQRSAPAVREMFVKGRSGAYLPVGLPERTNVDATSPWRYLTNRIDASKSYSDACPDCVAELHIRKRELDQSSEGSVQPTVQAVRKIATNDGSMNPIASGFATLSVPADQSNSNPPSVIEKQGVTESTKPAAETPEEVSVPFAGDSAGLSRGDTFGSTLVEPSSSLRSSPYPVSVASSNEKEKTSSMDGDGLASTRAGSEAQSSSGSVREESYPADGEQPTSLGPRTKSVHFRDPPPTIEGGQLVISRDLGEGYDAMILERGGRLERLVMNSRHGQPNAETMARIARELLMVSSALSDAQAGLSPESSTTSETDRTVVVDRGSHVEFAQEVSDDEVISLFDEATGTLEPGLAHHTPSPIPHAQHPDIEGEYEALQEHFGVNEPYASFAEAGDSLLSRQALQPSQQSTSRWPIPLNYSFGSTQSLMTDRYRSSSDDSQPPASIRVSSRNSNMGSEEVPITTSSPEAEQMSSSPTLPSHVLRAEDTMSPTLPEPHSPLFFTSSTAPSLGEPSPIFGKVLPIYPENPMSSPLPGPPTPTAASPQVAPQSPPESFRELSRADSKVIRHVMRMDIQNKAVQEAAEKERQARRQRSILADAKRALGIH